MFQATPEGLAAGGRDHRQVIWECFLLAQVSFDDDGGEKGVGEECRTSITPGES